MYYLNVIYQFINHALVVISSFKKSNGFPLLITYCIQPFNDQLTLEIKLIKGFSQQHKANLIDIEMTETQASLLLVLYFFLPTMATCSALRSYMMCLLFITPFCIFYFNVDHFDLLKVHGELLFHISFQISISDQANHLLAVGPGISDLTFSKLGFLTCEMCVMVGLISKVMKVK